MAIVPALRRHLNSANRGDHCAAGAALLALLPLALASFLAALAAHVALDVAGDFLLAHDAYDGIAHGSRSTVVLLALAVTLGAGGFVLWSALAQRVPGRYAMGGASRVFPMWFSRFAFVAAVVAGTLVTLAGMEALDTLAQSGRIDDVRDLLGGSLKLALSIALPIATVVALATRAFFATMSRSCVALAASAGELLLQMLGRFESGCCARRGRPVERSVPRTSPLARRAGKRAPPKAAFA